MRKVCPLSEQMTSELDLEMCLENGLWIDGYREFCAKFNYHPGGLISDLKYDVKEMQSQARKLYSNFIKVGGANELNLTTKLRRNMRERVEKPRLDMFDDVTKEVKSMMLLNSFPRFATVNKEMLINLG